MKNWISLFTLMIALAACSNAEADVFAEVRAGNGDLSVIFADDLFGPHANSAAASLTDINPGGSTSMSGESSVAQTTVNGLSTLQFKTKGSVFVSESGPGGPLDPVERMIESAIIWQDVLVAAPGQSGNATLRFKVDGNVIVQDTVEGNPEQWRFLMTEDPTFIEAIGEYNSTTFTTHFPAPGLQGWNSFTDLGNGDFEGTIDIPIAFDTPFDLLIQSRVFVHDIESMASADLGNTITLEAILDGSNQQISAASFGSGVSFSGGGAAIPEPSSFALAVVGLFGFIGVRRFRSTSPACSVDA